MATLAPVHSLVRGSLPALLALVPTWLAAQADRGSASAPPAQAVNAAIERGVEHLLKAQNRDGSWGLDLYERGLAWHDPHAFGLDYAETLRRWRSTYDNAVAAGRLADFSPEFHDLWRYYLMYCEGGFRGGGIDVAQVTLEKD